MRESMGQRENLYFDGGALVALSWFLLKSREPCSPRWYLERTTEGLQLGLAGDGEPPNERERAGDGAGEP